MEDDEREEGDISSSARGNKMKQGALLAFPNLVRHFAPTLLLGIAVPGRKKTGRRLPHLDSASVKPPNLA